MKSKGCEFGSYNGLSYRVCYGLTEAGKMDYSRELYEFHKNCKCKHCNFRYKLNREPSNHITVTTDDKNKFLDVEKIIKDWDCKSEKSENREYIRL